jgi:hypothetical protein
MHFIGQQVVCPAQLHRGLIRSKLRRAMTKVARVDSQLVQGLLFSNDDGNQEMIIA